MGTIKETRGRWARLKIPFTLWVPGGAEPLEYFKINDTEYVKVYRAEKGMDYRMFKYKYENKVRSTYTHRGCLTFRGVLAEMRALKCIP